MLSPTIYASTNTPLGALRPVEHLAILGASPLVTCPWLSTKGVYRGLNATEHSRSVDRRTMKSRSRPVMMPTRRPHAALVPKSRRRRAAERDDCARIVESGLVRCQHQDAAVHARSLHRPCRAAQSAWPCRKSVQLVHSSSLRNDARKADRIALKAGRSAPRSCRTNPIR